MISGTVNELLEATLSLTVRSHKGEVNAAAVIDTGFTGFLTLPESVVNELDLFWLGRQQGMLADGSRHMFDVFVGEVIWDGETRQIEVEAAEIDPLSVWRCLRTTR